MIKIGKPERKRTENDVKDEIRRALAEVPEIRIFRNNVGMLRDERGAPVRYGLGTGSADLIGSVTIAEGVAIAFAVEVKRPGEKLDAHQREWLTDKRRMGWIACVATSAGEAVSAIAAYCRSSPVYSATQVPGLAALLARYVNEAG